MHLPTLDAPQPLKPRFFKPQPVHLDYMHALDNLRASRSPSASTCSPSSPTGRHDADVPALNMPAVDGGGRRASSDASSKAGDVGAKGVSKRLSGDIASFRCCLSSPPVSPTAPGFGAGIRSCSANASHRPSSSHDGKGPTSNNGVVKRSAPEKERGRKCSRTKSPAKAAIIPSREDPPAGDKRRVSATCEPPVLIKRAKSKISSSGLDSRIPGNSASEGNLPYPSPPDPGISTKGPRTPTCYHPSLWRLETSNNCCPAVLSDDSLSACCSVDLDLLCSMGCEERDICWEPCLELADCEGTDCFDQICCADQEFTTTSAISGPDDATCVDPAHLMLSCHWGTSDESCDVTLPNESSLSKHILEDHIQTQATLSCQWNDCTDAVAAGSLSQHVRHDHGVTPQADSYVCLWHGCGQHFGSGDDLDQHMKTEHCRLSCLWNGCQQPLTEEVLTQHVQRHAQAELTSTKSSNCALHDLVAAATVVSEVEAVPARTKLQVKSTPSRNAGVKTCQWIDPGSTLACGQDFPDGNCLQTHLEEVHLTQLKAAPSHHHHHHHAKRAHHHHHASYVCHWASCSGGKTAFPERSKLARHLYTHTAYKIGSCQHCGKEFNNINQLQDHERTHTNERPYVCTTCGFKATNKPALRTHMRTHTGEKPLLCEKCGYTCGDPSNMSKHRKIHEGPVHQCPVCQRGFCRMATLRRHLTTHDRT